MNPLSEKSIDIILNKGRSFYCKGHPEGDFDIEKWNEDYVNCHKAGIPFESDQKEVECTEQCFDCMADIGQRRTKTKSLMNRKNLTVGQWVFFTNEEAPMKVLAMDRRFMICSRELSLDHDRELLEHEVEMQAFFDIDEAFQFYKDDPVYTIVDFTEGVKGPHNIIFNSYDFDDAESMNELLTHLGTGETEISHRNRIPMTIDWIKTEAINSRK